MLDRARDADGDIQLRRDDLAGLADLVVVRHEAGVDRGARGAQRGVELVGERRQHLGVVLARAHATATRDDDLGGGQFRTVALGHFARNELRNARVGHGRQGLDGGRATFGSGGVEGRAAHGDDLDLVFRLDRGNGVAGVDRALEGVRGVDLGDFRDLGHVQLGGHARQDVLAVRGGRGQDVRVVVGDGQRLLGHVLGQAVAEVGGVGQQDLGHAGDLGGGIGRGLGVGAGHQHVYVAAALGCGGHGVERGALDRLIVVFSNDECSHVISPPRSQITLASFFSFCTSVATSGTITPALRLGGSTTFRVDRRGLTSTPRSSGLTVSSGFFFAFMMFGSVT